MLEAGEIRLGRLKQCTFEQTLELRNRGFVGDYTKTEPITINQMLAGLVEFGIQPELSVVAFIDEQPVGYVYIAIKTEDNYKLAWNGGTGVIREFRGKGIAKAMMREAQRIIQEQQVDRATLDVVTQNTHAIVAYQNGGFEIVDRMLGAKRSGPLETPFYKGDLPEGIQFKYGKPRDVSQLSFYRDKVSWECLWYNIKDGEAITLCDSYGVALAYALFKRNRDENGEPNSIALYQCEIDPALTDQKHLIRIMLQEVYGPYHLPCERSTANLSMSNPELIEILQEFGFVTAYEQYLMLIDKER